VPVRAVTAPVREIARRRHGATRMSVVAQLVQRFHHPGHRPTGQGRRVAPAHPGRHPGPGGGVDAVLVQGHSCMRQPTGSAQQFRTAGYAAGFEPPGGLVHLRPADRQALAAAAHRGQQGLGLAGRQQQSQKARWFLQGLEQSVGGHIVHRLRRMDQAILARARELLTWAQSIAARTASTLMSRLGFALVLDVPSAPSSTVSQPSLTARASGSSTRRSGCARAATNWQAAHRPQAWRRRRATRTARPGPAPGPARAGPRGPGP
jgi:hypothetical protein